MIGTRRTPPCKATRLSSKNTGETEPGSRMFGSLDLARKITSQNTSRTETQKKFALTNEQFLELEGLLGRITSASYMPNVDGEERFTELTEAVTGLFDGSEKKGEVRLLYDTVVSLRSVGRVT